MLLGNVRFQSPALALQELEAKSDAGRGRKRNLCRCTWNGVHIGEQGLGFETDYDDG